jgi:hypothetical protein
MAGSPDLARPTKALPISCLAHFHNLSEKMMKDQRAIAHSLLWAAAIIASALVKAPTLLTLTLLPCLAAGFVLISHSTARTPRAGASS